MGLGEPERVQRADAVDLEGVDRVPQVVPWAGRTCEVQDEVDGVVDDERLRDVLPLEPEPGVAGQVGQVAGRPSQEVVDRHDVPVPPEKIVAEVRAEEPGGAGDQDGRGRSAARAHTRARSARSGASPRPRL